MTLPRTFRVLVVCLAPLAVVACGAAPGGVGDGAIIADLEPLPPEDESRNGVP